MINTCDSKITIILFNTIFFESKHWLSILQKLYNSIKTY